MFHIAIVEDEWQCSSDLETCLKRYAMEYGLEFGITCYKKGEDFLFQYQVDTDIVFMDVDMPGINGFETAKRLREMDPDVVLIFVTFLAKYAQRGYEVNAMDYIIKPIQYELLRLKIEKALSLRRMQSEKETLIETQNGLVRVSLSRIPYIEIMGHSILYHTEQGDITGYGTLKAVEKSLPAGQFYRSNSSVLVNLRCVTRIEGDEVFMGSQSVFMSRGKKKEFLKALHEFYSS